MLTSRNFDISTDYTVETSDVGSPPIITLGTFNLRKWPAQIVYLAYDNGILNDSSSKGNMRLIHITERGERYKLEGQALGALGSFYDAADHGIDFYGSGLPSTSFETNNIEAGKIEILYRPPSDYTSGFSSRVFCWGSLSYVGLS